MRRIYESSIKRNSGEQNNIHYVIYWICIDNMPILIAISTRDYYDEKFYDSKNGYFNYYYSVRLTNMGKSISNNFRR